MIPHYKCPTCGHMAVWHLNLDTHSENLCENCIYRFMSKTSHVKEFVLNRYGYRKLVIE